MNKIDTLRAAFLKAAEAHKLDTQLWGAELTDSNLVSRDRFRTYEVLMPSPDLDSGERVKPLRVSKDDVEKGDVEGLTKRLKKDLESDYQDNFDAWRKK